MKTNCFVRSLSWLLLPALAACSSPGADATGAHRLVRHVIDGDTVILTGGTKVRIAGIDTPELRPSPEPGAEAARDRLRELVSGVEVRIETIPPGRDVHGRTLARLYLPDGRDVGGALVREGHAVVYETRDQPRGREYYPLEAAAREQGLGIWRGLRARPAALAGGGERAVTVVGGRVGRVRHSGGHAFLDFFSGEQESFTAVLYEDTAVALDPPPDAYEGRLVTVVGEIRDGPRGHPEMVVRHPSRLTLLD